MSQTPTRAAMDIPFSIPAMHRLRFTDDILGNDRDLLWELLQRSGSHPAKVQVWLDEPVANANPGLAQRFDELLRSRPRAVEVNAQPQLIDGGEACKNDMSIIDGILEQINALGLDRRSYVIVVGGGAVLDTVGYAASIAHRGIRLIRLPTTTLGQADSGVGVKNAVNRFGKKNWVGTFAVPWAVINDATLLKSLPDHDFRCGFSEAVKVFLLKSADAFNELCELAPRIRNRDREAFQPVIARSAEYHIQHITQGGDPFEIREARPLDFGHWSAHKLEPMSNYMVRHGEAVGMGVAADVAYSSLAHGLPWNDAERVFKCMKQLGLPLSHPLLMENSRLIFDGLEEFRQHLGGRLTITMLRGIGEPIDVHEVDRELMGQAFRRVAMIERELT